MSAACASLLLQATAVPFFASTRPKDACAGCPKQHCSAAFAKCAQVHHETVPLQHHHVYSTLLWWCNACTPERQATPDVGLSAGGVEARSLSIGGGLATNAQRSCLNPPPSGSPTSGVACLSDADSPMISSSVTSHDSDVFDCLMEVSCVAATSGACETCHDHAPDFVCQQRSEAYTS